jgi:hypothetical protein
MSIEYSEKYLISKKCFKSKEFIGLAICYAIMRSKNFKPFMMEFNIERNVEKGVNPHRTFYNCNLIENNLNTLSRFIEYFRDKDIVSWGAHGTYNGVDVVLSGDREDSKISIKDNALNTEEMLSIIKEVESIISSENY